MHGFTLSLSLYTCIQNVHIAVHAMASMRIKRLVYTLIFCLEIHRAVRGGLHIEVMKPAAISGTREEGNLKIPSLP